MWLTAAQLGKLVGELADIQRTPEIHSTAQGQKNTKWPGETWKNPENTCSRRTYTPAYMHKYIHTYKHAYTRNCTYMNTCNHNHDHSARNTPPAMDLMRMRTTTQVQHLHESILHMMADSLNTEDAHLWLFHRRKIRAQFGVEYTFVSTTSLLECKNALEYKLQAYWAVKTQWSCVTLSIAYFEHIEVAMCVLTIHTHVYIIRFQEAQSVATAFSSTRHGV